MPRANLRRVLTAGRRSHLPPEPGARESHLRKTIVRGAAALHPDIYATARRRHSSRIQNNSLREGEIDWRKRGAANRQIVEHILVHEIRDVAHHGLRMHVVRRRILGRRSFEIERQRLAFFYERQITGAYQRGSPTDRVIEYNRPELAVGQRLDLL